MADQALDRVRLWHAEWPGIAERCFDSEGRPARYSFFFPAEAYSPELIAPLAELCHLGVANIEVHLHHGGETETEFCDLVEAFVQALHQKHGVARWHDGRLVFGFIHGDWALDNSLPDGGHCGLNNELTLLVKLGCYADFTMPSGDSPTQAAMVNQIYWAQDDPHRPKSYNRGTPLRRGDEASGRLLMIPGPFGHRQVSRSSRPRIMSRDPYPETGELASYHRSSPERVSYWMDLAPRVGNDVFLKLYTHGAQERHSSILLGADGDLARTYQWIGEECRRRGWDTRFAATWEMFQRIEEIRNPGSTPTPGSAPE
jgi:hypothetical protein